MKPPVLDPGTQLNRGIWSCDNVLDAINYADKVSGGQIPPEIASEVFHRRAALITMTDPDGGTSIVQYKPPDGIVFGPISPLQAATLMMSGAPFRMFRNGSLHFGEDPIGNRLIKTGKFFRWERWDDPGRLDLTKDSPDNAG